MNYDKIFVARPLLPKWGEIALSAFVVALISGVALIPGFTAFPKPFQSVSHLVSSGIVGRFLHSCHSYASDVFLLAGLIHTLEYILKKAYTTYTLRAWFWLVLLLLMGFGVAFSGFLSTGSLEALDAGRILASLFDLLGQAGSTLKHFLFMSTSYGSSQTILLHHVSTFSLLGVLLLYKHLTRLQPDVYALYYTLLLIALVSFIFPVHLGTAPQAQATVLKGPWYFRGLQEMLVWLPAWLGGIVLPLLMLFLFALLPLAGKNARWLHWGLAVAGIFYGIETLILTFSGNSGWPLNTP